MMRPALLFAVGASLVLANCGTGLDKRITAGVFAGGAIGAMAGPIGLAVGAGVGAIAGAVTPEDVARLDEESEPRQPAAAAENPIAQPGS
jgi:hypothetical protein